MRYAIACLLFLAIAATVNAAELPSDVSAGTAPLVTWFSTGGETIYHLRGARTDPGVPRSIIAAAYSGKVLCFDFAGEKLWEQTACRDFPFSLDAGDLDGDGFDECAVAAADGSLYIIDHDGRLLAKVFEGKPPLCAVKIVGEGSANASIVCGGAERILYRVSADGKILNQARIAGAIEGLDTGHFSKAGETGLAVFVQTGFKNSQVAIHQLPGLAPQGAPRNAGREVKRKGGKDTGYFFRMIAVDIDGDGRDEIALGGKKGGAVRDAAGEQMIDLEASSITHGQQTYSMLMLDKATPPTRKGESVFGVSASVVRVYDASGKIAKEVDLPFSPAGLHYDPATETLLLGSAQSGGDCVYCVRILRPGWEESLREVKFQGKLRQIVKNIETLTAQVARFERPAYQPAEAPDALCVFAVTSPNAPSSPAELNPANSFVPLANLYRQEFPYPHLQFAGNQWISENWDRTNQPEGWDRVRDRRMPYRLTSKEIVDYARRLEVQGLPFVWTVGHGNDPFFVSLSTIEGILRAAPTTCKGFLYPEVARDDTPAFRYAVEAHVKPVCDLCLKYGKRKVFLRSKYLFWVADCRTDMWRWMLENKKYADVIVPAMEETNERLGDLSLSGRVGLRQGGWFSDWAGRAVLDNPCYDRQNSWAATMVGSHFLRALCYQAALGARYHLIQLSEARGARGSAEFRDHVFVVNPFLHMVGKGILPGALSPGSALSLSPVGLGMRVPSTEFVEASHNSHEITTYRSDPPWVFSRLECFWGQAPTPEYDFGYYGVGRRRQGLNFVPKNPYGLVPIMPSDAKASEVPGVERLLLTDGESWYDEQGKRHTAAQYARQVEDTLRAASDKMFVQVRGDVAWTATRLDKSHVRLVLIDPGYLDPADRVAEVTVHAEVVKATDILSREPLDVRSNTLTVTVPMGILSVIDIEHR